ncbi:MAG: multiple sugar transport system substrate-binding protein [Actinomycetota bacterium]|nr:multiple sugar transport system substrate-binding protein [Actinomycetota bacterium]
MGQDRELAIQAIPRRAAVSSSSLSLQDIEEAESEMIAQGCRQRRPGGGHPVRGIDARRRRRFQRRYLALATAAAALLAACSGSSVADNDLSIEDLERGAGGSVPSQPGGDSVTAALQAGGDLTVWAWEPTLKQVVTEFQKEYPKVRVNLVDAGTGNDQYTALEKAVKAGSGIPDVAQIEYYALPQFGLGKSLTDLKDFGTSQLKSTFTTGPWNSVASGDSVFGLPMDSGPMALFYNKTVFDRLKVAVPTTWEEYLDAARKIHKADSRVFIANDAGDPGFTTSMIWQAGGKPYQVEGTTVKVNLADEGSTKFAGLWQTLIGEKLLSSIPNWSDEWFKGLGDGTLATLVTGAWMPANFSGPAEAAKGQWRVAPMPQWTAGGKSAAENGGSSLAVPKAASNPALAYGFVKYATTGNGAKTRIANGAFPATTADLKDEEFLAKAFPYFGGQKANTVFAESAANVISGWSYLPVQVYANSIFKDTVGPAFTGGTTLAKGLIAWQEASTKYAADQGFTIG